MRKIRLELDALEVESMVIPALDADGGTVRGHSDDTERSYNCFTPGKPVNYTYTCSWDPTDCKTLYTGG